MSDTPPIDQPTTTGADFTSPTCGNFGGSADGTTQLLPLAGWLAINGSTDLSRCVVGPAGASVTSIYVTSRPPGQFVNFAYRVWVYGQGPLGFASGSLELTFFDQTGSNYSVALSSSTPSWHYVDYNSAFPGIKGMRWGRGRGGFG